MDHDIRFCPNLCLFKEKLLSLTPEPRIIYYYGKRWASIHHSRLRMGCSLLNYDLCYKVYVRDDPSCNCGAPLETSYHYFFQCPRYNLIRNDLDNTINAFSSFTLKLLLYSDPDLSYDSNKTIFDAVH